MLQIIGILFAVYFCCVGKLVYLDYNARDSAYANTTLTKDCPPIANQLPTLKSALFGGTIIPKSELG